MLRKAGKREGERQKMNCSRYMMDECRCELHELDLLSDSASLSCTWISYSAFQAFLSLDLYPGSQQTGYDLDFYTGSHQTGCAFRYRQNARRCGYHLVSRLSSG